MKAIDARALGHAAHTRDSVLESTNSHDRSDMTTFCRAVASGGDGLPRGWDDFNRAMNAHDLEGVRGALPKDIVIDDHRRTGFGRLERAEAWIESIAAVYELSPDVRVDDLYDVAISPRGRVSVSCMWGVNLEGGAFESYVVRLFRYRSEQIIAIDVFEIEDLDAALARFEEFGPE
jgi:hypothetical protein